MNYTHRFAVDTSVPVERSKAQIRGYLAQVGADGFADIEEKGRVVVAFTIDGKKYILGFYPLPKSHEQFRFTPKGRERKPAQSLQLWEQDVRSRWRALLMIVKANCESVALGMYTPEHAFGNNLVLGDNRTTVGEAVARAAIDGKLPMALPLLSSPK